MASGELQQVRCEALHWPFVFFSPASLNYLGDISPGLKPRGFLLSQVDFPASLEIAQKTFAFGVLHRLHRHTFPEPQGRCEP